MPHWASAAAVVAVAGAVCLHHSYYAADGCGCSSCALELALLRARLAAMPASRLRAVAGRSREEYVALFVTLRGWWRAAQIAWKWQKRPKAPRGSLTGKGTRTQRTRTKYCGEATSSGCGISGCADAYPLLLLLRTRFDLSDGRPWVLLDLGANVGQTSAVFVELFAHRAER
eukprot:gene10626-63447_t